MHTQDVSAGSVGIPARGERRRLGRALGAPGSGYSRYRSDHLRGRVPSLVTTTRGIVFGEGFACTDFDTTWWMPASEEPGDKAMLQLLMTVPSGMTVIATGKTSGASLGEPGWHGWRFEEGDAFSPYLFGFAAGTFTDVHWERRPTSRSAGERRRTRRSSTSGRKRRQVAANARFDVPLTHDKPYPSLQIRRAVQYSKGALFLDLLRHELGEEAFWKGIREYTREHQGGLVRSRDLQVALEGASGKKLQALFEEWVYE